jgi:hypothetical protein
MYLNIPYNYFLKHFSLKEEMSEILSKMYVALHVKYPLFLSDLNETLIFWTDFRKYFLKIRPVCAKLFHMDGRTNA